MAKKIFSVGFDFPGGIGERISLASDRSLLDADIIVFKPGFEELALTYCLPVEKILDDASASSCRVAIGHWNSQLRLAMQSGKTVFIFLSALEDNRHGKDVVHSYQFVPVKRNFTPASGKQIVLNTGQGFLLNYWNEFCSSSVYRVYIEDGGSREGNDLTPTFMTKTGDKDVGVVQQSIGAIILLPSLEFDIDSFYTGNEEEGEPIWTKEGLDFGNRLSSCFIEIDKSLHSGRASTPSPTWVRQSTYRLLEETTIELHIQSANQQIDELISKREMLLNNLEKAGSLYRLLFEAGHPLEEAIIEALHLLGFKAENYKEGESEFDAVFTSAEGRFLGEAEGKDNKAINIDKFRQLITNLQEDYERDDVSEHAKGILFGNASRLTSPAERGEFFTAKCLSSAKQYKTALVRTPDLFAVARYLKEQRDEDFAKRCRETLRDTKGDIVQFPPVPSVATSIDVVEADGVAAAEGATP